MAGAAARLDDDARRSPNDVGGLSERVGVARRDRRNRETFRQGFKIEVLDDLGLDVDWQAQIERASEIGLVHGLRSASERVAQRFRRMQNIRSAENVGQAAELTLPRADHLLHIVPFAVGRLVAIEVIDANSVGRCGEGARVSLKRAGTNRSQNRRRLAIDPSERSCRVSHRHFVSALKEAQDALFGINAQDLANVGVSVPEDAEELSYPLFQQSEDDAFRHRDVNAGIEPSVAQRPA